MAESAQLARYKAFNMHSAALDTAGMRACVDPERFYAVLPGLGRLTFDEFAAEFERLRMLSPDLGHNIEYRTTVEEGPNLAVCYYMWYTVATAAPRRIELTSLDLVEFDANGKIISVRVFYDRSDALAQLNTPPTYPSEHYAQGFGGTHRKSPARKLALLP